MSLYDGYRGGYPRPVDDDIPPPPKKIIHQRKCQVCHHHTLVKLCFFLFGELHCKCDDWACYRCKARTRNGFWTVHEETALHTELEEFREKI